MDTDVILENALNREKMFFFYYKSILGGKKNTVKFAASSLSGEQQKLTA